MRADSVVTATGQTSLLASRRVAGFGAVNELQSTSQSDTKQLTISLGGFGLRGAMFNTGYTWSRSRDEGSGGPMVVWSMASFLSASAPGFAPLVPPGPAA